MHITHVITGLSDGGAEAVLHRLCTNDNANRHTVISLMDEGKHGPLLDKAGIEVHCMNLPRGRLRPGALWRLWRLLRSFKPDVVQTWMYHADLIGGLAARLAGQRTIVWGIRHTTLEPGKSSRATILIARVLARLSRRVPCRIAVCAQSAVAVHGELGYDTARMVVIPNGYDLSRFAPDAAARARLRAEWRVPETLPLIGMVGRFDPQKDHANLVRALGLLDARGAEFACVLIGTGVGTRNATLRRQIENAGLDERVRLLGRRDDVPAVMNALDLHALPSAYGEAFPNVLAEAIACGTPCVTTDVGDAGVIVGDTGWVVPPRNPQALAEALERALLARRDAAAWAERQERARARIEREFSLDKMVGRYRALWEEVRQCV